MYRLWTCRGSDYKLSRCPAIKMKTSISWANILWRNATCEVCGFYQQHSLRSSYTVYQAVLGCLTHTLRLRSRKSSNNSNASTNPHTKCFWVVFLYFLFRPLSSSLTWQPVKLEQWRGEEKFAWQKVFLFVLFFFYYLEWRLKCKGTKSRLKKRIQFALCLSMV